MFLCFSAISSTFSYSQTKQNYTIAIPLHSSEKQKNTISFDALLEGIIERIWEKTNLKFTIEPLYYTSFISDSIFLPEKPYDKKFKINLYKYLKEKIENNKIDFLVLNASEYLKTANAKIAVKPFLMTRINNSIAFSFCIYTRRSDGIEDISNLKNKTLIGNEVNLHYLQNILTNLGFKGSRGQGVKGSRVRAQNFVPLQFQTLESSNPMLPKNYFKYISSSQNEMAWVKMLLEKKVDAFFANELSLLLLPYISDRETVKEIKSLDCLREIEPTWIVVHRNGLEKEELRKLQSTSLNIHKDKKILKELGFYIDKFRIRLEPVSKEWFQVLKKNNRGKN